MNYVLKNKYYEATVSTLGAEMISLKNKDGRELLWQNTTGKGWSSHAPILFPLCGNIKDGKAIYKGKEYAMRQHGFARNSEFEVVSADDERLVLLLSSSETTLAQYPFDFKFTIAYALDGEKITLEARVENTGSEILPYSFGWHPGFALFTDGGQDIEDYAVKFDSVKEVTWVKFYNDFDVPNDYLPYPTPNSEYKLCEEEIYKYDTMVFKGAGNKVILKADGHPYELDFSWTENIPALCIWKSASHETKFVCIEPWTHDTIRGVTSNHWEEREAHRLNPGEKEDFKYTLRFKF